jgi:hypothetical protein
MIVLLDRNFDPATLISELAANEADLLVCITSNRKPPVLRRYPDGRSCHGSALSRSG